MSLDILVRQELMRNATVVSICTTSVDGSHRCGYCGRGVLGDQPRMNQRCRVCGAVVVQTSTIELSDRTSAAGSPAIKYKGEAGARKNGPKGSHRPAVAKKSAAPGSSGPADSRSMKKK